MKPKIAVIIPARMASTRFPGKPLVSILGIPMIEHVRRRASLCPDLAGVFVATCDKEIEDAVKGYAGEVIMTSARHQRCTDRVAEAALLIDADIIINIQGDEPLVVPEMITQVAGPLLEDKTCEYANLLCPIRTEEEFTSPNVIKAVVGIRGEILYFSRQPIPYAKAQKSLFGHRQLGIIAFTRQGLVSYSRFKETPLEKTESIDMLRLLENGLPVKAAFSESALYEVDIPDDVAKVEALMKQDNLLKEYI